MSKTIRQIRARDLAPGNVLVQDGVDYPIEEVRWYGPRDNRVVRAASSDRAWVFQSYADVAIRPPEQQP